MFKVDVWLRIIFFERDIEMSWVFIYVSIVKLKVLDLIYFLRFVYVIIF